MQYYYLSNYSLDLCLEYMKHDNIYDKFSYKWEKTEENDYFITFIEYKNSILSLANSPKPTFRVIFEDLGGQYKRYWYVLGSKVSSKKNRKKLRDID